MNGAIAMLGAGAWGTGLAIHLAARLPVRLWCRDAALAATLSRQRQNAKYLPGLVFPAGLDVVSDLSAAVREVALIIVAAPSSALPEVIGATRSAGGSAPLIWLCKGFLEEARLPHQFAAPLWPAPCGVLSGPSFAEEVAARLPTAVTLAATEADFAREAANQLRDETLRIYVSEDLVGVEIGGALKNVMAIAAGICDGLGFGHNARAALITRGLAEIGRLSAALGGRRDTLMGLAGLGDLVLTCTGDLSRNRRVGLELARGRKLGDVLAELGHVAEGVRSARAARLLATAHGVDMPISLAVARVLDEGLDPRLAVSELLSREPGSETR